MSACVDLKPVIRRVGSATSESNLATGCRWSCIPRWRKTFSTGRLRCHDELDADKSQVRLLRNDHLKMLEDLDDWRSKTEP